MAFSVTAGHAQSSETALSIHRFLLRLSASAGNAFLWVFIMQWYAVSAGTIGRALGQTLLLYALSQTIAILLTPFAMRLLRGGMRRGMIWGTLFCGAALVYVAIFIGGAFGNGAIVVAALFGAYRAFYRVPYAVVSTNRVSLTAELILALAPACAGLLLVHTGAFSAHAPAVLLFIAGALALCALLPLPFVPQVYEAYGWDYRESFGRLFAPENHRLLIASVRQGMLGALLFLIWPLILFFVLGGSYVALGAAFSGTLLVIFLFRARKRRVMVDEHADGGNYLDEYTALKEMGMAAGRLALALAAALALSLWGF